MRKRMLFLAVALITALFSTAAAAEIKIKLGVVTKPGSARTSSRTRSGAGGSAF
jgi:ABC-type sugar transport system substrate-binding protein